MKLLFIPDTQVKVGVNIDHIKALGNYIVDKKPEIIVMIGDWWDMPSLSSYEKKGSRYFEGLRYRDDVEAGLEAMESLFAPMNEYNAMRVRNRKKPYRPRLVYTEGNHECLDDQTEVLTSNGWKKYTEISLSTDQVYSLDENLNGMWSQIKRVHEYDYEGPMLVHESRGVSMCVTPNHRIVYTTNSDGKLHEKLASEAPKSSDVIVSASKEQKGIEYEFLTDDEIRLAGWLTTDSYFGNKTVVIYQRESNSYKIRDLLNSLSIPFIEKTRNRDITEICGKKLKEVCEPGIEFHIKNEDVYHIGVTSNKHLPPSSFFFSERQFDLFLKVLIDADGSIPTKAKSSRVFYGRKEICDDLQSLAVVNGWRASLTEYRENQWRVNLTKTNVCRVENFLPYANDYSGKVWCLTVEGNENFLVRRNNKCHFTGNSRVTRALNEDPRLIGTIGFDDFQLEKFGFEAYRFLHIVEIEGVAFSHYFVNPDSLTGSVVTGSIENKLKLIGQSFGQGHQQKRQYGNRFSANGKEMHGLVLGAFYSHSEEYMNPQGNQHHWRGICMMHELREGRYDPSFISLDFLVRKWLG